MIELVLFLTICGETIEFERKPVSNLNECNERGMMWAYSIGKDHPENLPKPPYKCEEIVKLRGIN